MMQSFLDGDEGYTTKYLRDKLQQHYGEQIIITNSKGRLENIVTFRDRGYQVLREQWVCETKADVLTEKERIIDMAASIIRDDIQMQVYDCSLYPSIENTDDGCSVVTNSPNRFLHGVIKSKSTNTSTADRRCTAIAHATISACRSRSFISPILLSIAVYIHHKIQF